MRATMCMVELLAWPLLWWIVVTSASNRHRHLLAISYIASPVAWVSTVMMCQDEAISMALFAAVAIALLRSRLRLATFLCGVGVVAAKVYFLVPLVGLLGIMAGRTWKDWLYDVLAGVAPIAAVYGLQALLIGRAEHALVAFENFVVSFPNSVNIWGLIHRFDLIGDEQARASSAVIAIALSMLPLLTVRLRGMTATPIEQVQTIVAMLLWVYLSFFHINAEYFLIIVPGVLVAFRPMIASMTLLVGFSIPWAVNFFYGVALGMELGDAGRAPFVGIYQRFLAADPRLLQGISVVLMTAVTLGLASILTWKKLATGAIAKGDLS
jgi:hypothetical protein